MQELKGQVKEYIYRTGRQENIGISNALYVRTKCIAVLTEPYSKIVTVRQH
jgi:hypothetical protein